jgi:hypothetical protein
MYPRDKIAPLEGMLASISHTKIVIRQNAEVIKIRNVENSSKRSECSDLFLVRKIIEDFL